MNNCADNIYVIYYTNVSSGHIPIMRASLLTDIVDIDLLGKVRLEYGEVFNENCLHLLEHFSAPSEEAAYANLLKNPTTGQIWFNSTLNRPYQYDGSAWIEIGMASDVRGNSGVLEHGQQIPRPIDPSTGNVYTHAECSWVVAPFNFPHAISYMQCNTTADGTVIMEYIRDGESAVQYGSVSYQIIAIRGNTNLGNTSLPVTVTVNEPYAAIMVQPTTPDYEPRELHMTLNPPVADMGCTVVADKENTDLGFIDCVYSDCLMFDCAPKMNISVHVDSDSPYDLEISNITGTETLGTNYFFINQAGPISKSMLSETLTVRTNELSSNVTLEFRGNCDIQEIAASGTLEISAVNGYGKIISKTIKWEFNRLDQQ